MKMLKPTLSKKIFVLLLMSFCIVNVFNVFLDFNREKSHAYENLNDSYLQSLLYSLESDYQNQYDVLNASFINKVNQTLMPKYDINKDVIIFDSDYNIVYNHHSQMIPYLTLMDHSEINNSTIGTSLIFDLSSLDVETKNKLETKLKNKFNNETFIVKISSQIFTKNKIEQTSYKIDDISFLAIDNEVFFDNRQENEVIEELYFDTYESDNILLSVSEFYPSSEIGYHQINYQEIRENILNRLGFQMNSEILRARFFDNQFEKDGTLYKVTCRPLIKKGAIINEETGEYLLDDVQGYLVSYNYDFHAIDRIMNETIISKIPTYILSFMFSIVLCIVLSYMITRRIRKINQSTLTIADNDFNVHLDEKSKDELGILSHNINHMSQQLKQTMQQLNEEIEHVKQLEYVRKEFIANFTHEIKTPLGIIDGYIELIEVIKDEEKRQDYLEAIEVESKHINELVQAMLNLSRLESGHVELDIQEVDIEDLLTSTIELFAPLLKKKKIQIVLQGEFDSIQVDPFEFQIVIKNFISNAIKHTPHDGHIYISFDQNILSIENEGEHLTDAQKIRIWDTYVSGDREGTGLGLAICKTILDIHGFGYCVENTSRGVQFQIIIQ